LYNKFEWYDDASEGLKAIYSLLETGVQYYFKRLSFPNDRFTRGFPRVYCKDDKYCNVKPLN